MGFWRSLYWYWVNRIKDALDRAAYIIERDWGSKRDT